jgi:D-3-phosphoglycerate dehydrogenase / 2-oxoglutarate reductase
VPPRRPTIISVAERAGVSKRLGPLTALVAEGSWREREALPLGDLDGATLAVIGFGRIGRRVAELASAFGMRVLAHDPYADDASCGFEEALGAADVISLHAPLTTETQALSATPRCAWSSPAPC